MISATYEYRKGIFFLRLKEDSEEENYETIINKAGIKNIVINIEEINNVNSNQLNFIKKYYNKAKRKNMQIIICYSIDKYNCDYLNKINIHKISNELEAFQLLKI